MKYTIRLGKDKNGVYANISTTDVDKDGSVRVVAQSQTELGLNVTKALEMQDANPKWEVRIDPQTSSQLQGSQNDFLNVLDSTH